MKNYNNLKNLNQTYCSRNSYNSYKVRVKDKDKQAFHNFKEGYKVIRNIIFRDLGLCKVCLGKNRIRVADVVHHIIGLKENRELRLRISNLFSLCNSCN